MINTEAEYNKAMDACARLLLSNPSPDHPDGQLLERLIKEIESLTTGLQGSPFDRDSGRGL